MLLSTRRLLWLVVFLTSPSRPAFSEDHARNVSPPIATAGRIEVSEIRIARIRASDASPAADLTNMEIALWIDVEDATAREFLVRIVSLEPIVDDTGTRLSPDNRLRDIRPLAMEVRADESKSARGRRGPVVRLLLDAPSRAATRIRSLKGRVEVTSSGREIINLENILARVGKTVQHELLAETRIVPQIKSADGMTEVTLTVTGQHDRLMAWTIAQNGKPLEPESEWRSAEGGSVQTSGQDYRQLQLDQNTSLMMAVATGGKKQVIDFEFVNVDLP
jgi:hypothetical protein